MTAIIIFTFGLVSFGITYLIAHFTFLRSTDSSNPLNVDGVLLPISFWKLFRIGLITTLIFHGVFFTLTTFVLYPFSLSFFFAFGGLAFLGGFFFSGEATSGMFLIFFTLSITASLLASLIVLKYARQKISSFKLFGVILCLLLLTIPYLLVAYRQSFIYPLAVQFQQPSLCLSFSYKEFDGENLVTSRGSRCLKDSQTIDQYYAHCDLYPEEVRGYSQPFLQCIQGANKLKDDNGTSCKIISDFNLKLFCVSKFIGSPAWKDICSEALTPNQDNYFFKSGVIVAKCLNPTNVNIPLKQKYVTYDPQYMWFDYSVLGIRNGDVNLTRDEALSWLKSISADPKATEGSRTILMYVMGRKVTKDDVKALIDFGVDPQTIDSTGRKAIDYAFQKGALDAVDALLPYSKDFKPRLEDKNIFIHAVCYSMMSSEPWLEYFKNGKPCDNYEDANHVVAVYRTRGWLTF